MLLEVQCEPQSKLFYLLMQCESARIVHFYASIGNSSAYIVSYDLLIFLPLNLVSGPFLCGASPCKFV